MALTKNSLLYPWEAYAITESSTVWPEWNLVTLYIWNRKSHMSWVPWKIFMVCIISLAVFLWGWLAQYMTEHDRTILMEIFVQHGRIPSTKAIPFWKAFVGDQFAAYLETVASVTLIRKNFRALTSTRSHATDISFPKIRKWTAAKYNQTLNQCSWYGGSSCLQSFQRSIVASNETGCLLQSLITYKWRRFRGKGFRSWRNITTNSWVV